MRKVFELLVAKDGQVQMESQRVSIEDDDGEIRRMMLNLAEVLTEQGHSGEIYISRVHFFSDEVQTKELLDKLTLMYGTHRSGA